MIIAIVLWSGLAGFFIGSTTANNQEPAQARCRHHCYQQPMSDNFHGACGNRTKP